MRQTKSAEASLEAARGGSQRSSGDGRGATRLRPPPYGIAFTDQRSSPVVQAKGQARGRGAAGIERIAREGTRGPGGRLPYLDTIQRSFGPEHDMGAVRAHVGGRAAEEACQGIGATAYAMAGEVVFGGTPDLFTAAHEAAHVVQQLAGVHLKEGVGAPGDAYERHADAVASRVARGQGAADLLGAAPSSAGQASGIQMFQPGGVPSQAAADDAIIMNNRRGLRDVSNAMRRYWAVMVITPNGNPPGEANALRQIHVHLKQVPRDDTIGNAEWHILELSNAVHRGEWSPGTGTMRFPGEFINADANRQGVWRDRTIIHEAGHAEEERKGVAAVQTAFTETLAGWTIMNPGAFQMAHPAEHRALALLASPHHEDPMNRMFEAPDPAHPGQTLVFTQCTNGQYASFTEETRRKARRVSDYSLSAPREFFAEMYTEFYIGSTPDRYPDADFGNASRRMDNTWADWMRQNIHLVTFRGRTFAPGKSTPLP